jgi:hypothetical protein
MYRDSETTLYYFMLAAEIAGDAKIQGRLFRELLVASKDYGEGVRARVVLKGLAAPDCL